MKAKIALEEHFATDEAQLEHTPTEEADQRARMLDLDQTRLEEMDANGIELAVLSLTSPGVQGVVDVRAACRLATEVNDRLAEAVARHPDRFLGLASVPLQDPAAAADELERAVTKLGFRGAMVNGYTSTASDSTGIYYDDRRFDVFWGRAEALRVPVYLHPRLALPGQRRIYDGYPELLAASWGFGVETATHAIRLILGGIFDRHPQLQVVLGHLGEMLPFAIWRLEHRVSMRPHGKTLERPLSHYLRENFHVTTSGNFSTRALLGTVLELGVDRVLFAVDYPYESMGEGAGWFDTVPLNDSDRRRIGRENARRLLGLDGPAPPGR
jgi:predicted TIM-barrel fold metal-dependent hydrolase